jgi:hypothetical protein
MGHRPLGVESRIWSCAESWEEVVDGLIMVERVPDLSRTRRVIVRVFAERAEGALPPGSLDFRRANQIDMRDPRTMQWSVIVERDLGWRTGARLSYVGSRIWMFRAP